MKPALVIKTIRVGSLSIAIRRYTRGRFGFNHTPSGCPRVQVRLQSADDAEARARELLGMAAAGKVERMAIDPDEYARFLRWEAEQRKPAVIADVVPSFLAAKQAKGVAAPTLRELRSTLEPFARDFTGSLADVQRCDVERWLDARKVSPRRWNNMRAAIVALHHYVRRDGLLPAELTPVERMERRKVSVHVETYTPAELRALLDAVAEISPKWVPLIALGAFAGLRPEEIAPDPRNGGWKPGLKWENIYWTKGKIDVPAAVAKDRRRRFVPIQPALTAWLAPFARRTGFVSPGRTRHKLTPQWLALAGVEWKNDALRHSYASTRLAVLKDMAALSLEMGNSPAMIFRHYLDLKHEEEAAEWFAVMPADAAENVLSISCPITMITIPSHLETRTNACL